MKLAGNGKLLRIFVGEADKSGHSPLYEAIVQKTRAMGLAGATVLRGVESFGAASRIHTAKILRLSEDLPVVIEIVDTEPNIRKLLPAIDELFEKADCGGMITLEDVEVVKYVSGKKS